MPGKVTPISFLEEFFGVKFRAAADIGAIESELLQAGQGSRAIVFGSRGADEVGHVFNAVNQNGVVRFLDGQSGGQAVTTGYKELMVLRTN
jgi:hypothetical protein